MRTIHTDVYKFDELDDSAKEKARDWYRKASAGDNDFAEFVTEDFKEVLKACGFSLDRRNGCDSLQWSGFWSQGDGAAFGASWHAANVDVAAMLSDRPAIYKDEAGKEQTCAGNVELRALLEAAQDLAIEDRNAYGSTSTHHRHNYQVDTTYDTDTDESNADEVAQHLEARIDTFEELCRDLAHYFYRSLEREYEYQNSAEQVDEALRANEYEFTENGNCA